jgi:hypothetical protein
MDDRLRRLFEATPIGALPPMPLPMQASRNHNYFGARLQAGRRSGRTGTDLQSIGGGVDLQWQGGSIFGATAGYRQRECDDDVEATCGGHGFVGLRGRFNVLTGGPSLGALVQDPSATVTLGAEVGLGFAPNVATDLHACSFDLGFPISAALLQRIRLVPFVTPGIIWDIDCSPGEQPTGVRYMTSLGLGLQQLASRGLDVYLGFHKIFEKGTGYHFGVSVTYVYLR